jgi:hypothetical protein
MVEDVEAVVVEDTQEGTILARAATPVDIPMGMKTYGFDIVGSWTFWLSLAAIMLRLML